MKQRKLKLVGLALLLSTPLFAQNWQMQQVMLKTRWAKEVSPGHTQEGYPRPQLQRKNWANLNGLWDYKVVKKDERKPISYDGQILVPYPIESALSGVQKSLNPEQELWYKRAVIKPRTNAGDRVLLHFGAVDWKATIYINSNEVGMHSGGYTAFTIDITNELKAGTNELAVKVYDPTDAGFQPHGKQVLNPANIYYTSSSGIWQTVWLEVVPKSYIESMVITPDIDKKVVKITANSKSKTTITLTAAGKTIKGTTNKEIILPVTNPHLWSPEDPYLYDLTVAMGKDQVKSYFGMRKTSIAKDNKGITRICLNNKPYYNLGTLDQGFWPDGLYTAPTDEALKFDIEAIKAMGFNTIRKHIKVEPARWYYYADKLGMLVWQDMVNPDQSLREGSKSTFERESKEIVEQLHNYPSITTWVLFNERWGAYDQPRLTQWLKDLDPSRIVNGHTGELLYVNNKLRAPSENPYPNSDMTDVHAYPDPMMSLNQTGKAMVCGEFGGIGVSVVGHEWNDMQGWGYIQVLPQELDSKYDGMVKVLNKLKDQGLSGSIYTQPFDVEGEENGLITYDREIAKLQIARYKAINSQLVKTKAYQLKTSMRAVDAGQTDDQYQTLLQKYEQNPNQDSIALRRITLMAFRKKDQANLTKVGNSYIEQLKTPFTKDNLIFIQNITRTTDGMGFKLMLKSPVQINKMMGEDWAEKSASSIISWEIWAKLDDKAKQPDLESIENEAIQKYGEPGERAVWHALSGYAWNKQDVSLFVKYKDKAHRKFERDFGNTFYLNNDAWFVFEKSNNLQELESALRWQKTVLEKEEYKDGGSIDTYANILYKLGRKNEAIEWESKAIVKSDDPQLKGTLEKMKKGEKTWVN